MKTKEEIRKRAEDIAFEIWDELEEAGYKCEEASAFELADGLNSLVLDMLSTKDWELVMNAEKGGE